MRMARFLISILEERPMRSKQHPYSMIVEPAVLRVSNATRVTAACTDDDRENDDCRAIVDNADDGDARGSLSWCSMGTSAQRYVTGASENLRHTRALRKVRSRCGLLVAWRNATTWCRFFASKTLEPTSNSRLLGESLNLLSICIKNATTCRGDVGITALIFTHHRPLRISRRMCATSIVLACFTGRAPSSMFRRRSLAAARSLDSSSLYDCSVLRISSTSASRHALSWTKSASPMRLSRNSSEVICAPPPFTLALEGGTPRRVVGSPTNGRTSVLVGLAAASSGASPQSITTGEGGDELVPHEPSIEVISCARGRSVSGIRL